eukprot:TRINITY_DN12254_c0_g1_i2.p1 TRINITY_DN12254_c0_g1~~TRINITY_DN12254_c0_g1_i2.p1  ORF type:complete len:132 (+),score=19.45 TRINITY_DN12254_c0_g1_i2:229-624(+)
MFQELPLLFRTTRYDPEEALALQLLWMRSKKKGHRAYKITSDEVRYQIIHKVFTKKLGVSEVASEHNMKYSTVKNIVNLYIREGRFKKKRSREKKARTIPKSKVAKQLQKPSEVRNTQFARPQKRFFRRSK